MNRFLSQKFKFYSFSCIALLLFVHGYNLNETYLTPFSLVNEPLTFTTFVEYLFANGLLRFRLPLLFIISAYIFSLRDKRPYIIRIKKRFNTLIIPFLIWSAVGLAVTYLWQQFSITAQAVYESKLDQLGDNRPYSQIGWHGIFYRWLIRPVSFQLWFIRSLFVYNIMYPVIKWAMLKFPVIWLSLIIIFWHTIFSIGFIEGQGLFYFSIGVWLAKTDYPIYKKPAWFSPFLSWLFFVGLCTIKTFMAFEFESENPVAFYLLYLLHDLAVVSGIIAIWFGADPVVKWFMNKEWFQWASAFSFVIYAFHVPWLQYTTRLAFIFWRNVPNIRLLTYIVVPVITFFFCLAFGAALRRLFPQFYKVATGGRGL